MRFPVKHFDHGKELKKTLDELGQLGRQGSRVRPMIWTVVGGGGAVRSPATRRGRGASVVSFGSFCGHEFRTKNQKRAVDWVVSFIRMESLKRHHGTGKFCVVFVVNHPPFNCRNMSPREYLGDSSYHQIVERLTDAQRAFFQVVRQSVTGLRWRDIYVYGSIRRADYIPGKSDLDVDVFSAAPMVAVRELQQALHIMPKDVHAFRYRIEGKLVSGTKLNYKSELGDVEAEISVYASSDQARVEKEHAAGANLPSWMVFFLMLVKTLYYRLGVMPLSWYVECKRRIMNEQGKVKFVTL